MDEYSNSSAQQGFAQFAGNSSIERKKLNYSREIPVPDAIILQNPEVLSNLGSKSSID